MTASPSIPIFFAAASCQPKEDSLGSSRSTQHLVAARSAHPDDTSLGGLDFQRVVDLHYAPLYRFAMSLTRTEQDAGDLVQDTFLAWAAKGHQLRDRTKIKAWLFTTLHRRFLEGQRRTVRFPHLELTEAEADLPNVEPELVNSLDAQTVLELLARVDPQYRAALALFYLEDYSYQEIAAILEVPLGTVKSRIARGLGQLKELVLKHAPAAVRAEKEAS